MGYHIYLSVAKIQAQASQKMGNKNVVFTKDGLRVGVKHVENEKYVDATQGWVVKAWNLSQGDKNAKELKYVEACARETTHCEFVPLSTHADACCPGNRSDMPPVA